MPEHTPFHIESVFIDHLKPTRDGPFQIWNEDFPMPGPVFALIESLEEIDTDEIRSSGFRRVSLRLSVSVNDCAAEFFTAFANPDMDAIGRVGPNSEQLGIRLIICGCIVFSYHLAKKGGGQSKP